MGGFIKGEGMAGLTVGTAFGHTPYLSPSTLWEEIVKSYSYEGLEQQKGRAREYHVKWFLSLFDGEVIETTPGSQLDLDGIDIILRSNKGDLLFQVKSSPCGVTNYLQKKPHMAEKVALIWVDSSDPASRKRLLLLLTPVLKAKGMVFRPQVSEALRLWEALKSKGIKSLPSGRRCVLDIYTQEILTRLGLVELREGNYVLK